MLIRISSLKAIKRRVSLAPLYMLGALCSGWKVFKHPLCISCKQEIKQNQLEEFLSSRTDDDMEMSDDEPSEPKKKKPDEPFNPQQLQEFRKSPHCVLYRKFLSSIRKKYMLINFHTNILVAMCRSNIYLWYSSNDGKALLGMYS